MRNSPGSVKHCLCEHPICPSCQQGDTLSQLHLELDVSLEVGLVIELLAIRLASAALL